MRPSPRNLCSSDPGPDRYRQERRGAGSRGVRADAMVGNDVKVVDEVAESRTDSLLSAVEAARRDASLRLEPRRRALLGQFLTPAPVATFMAGMFECRKAVVHVLDPGAGSGALSAAFAAAMCRRRPCPDAIVLTAYEIDPLLGGYLRKIGEPVE